MRRAFVTAAAVLVVLASACTGQADAPAELPARSPLPSSTASDGDATAAPSPRAGDRQARVHPVSLPALFTRRYDGRRLRPGRTVEVTDAYTRRDVTFEGDGLTVSGQLLLPHGRGPFPVLVLAHGYIDPDVYVTGQGLRREQDWLARAGYAVLHVDYRNHASSDRDPGNDVRLRLGYTVDVVNAVHAVRRSGLARLDPDRVGLLGRSMGGGVVYNVLSVAPGLVDAAVVYAPVSSLAGDNFDRWIRDDPGRSELARRILGRYGAPEDRPGFWWRVSPRAYLDRVTEPVLIHHGTADESCPIRWSRDTLRALRAAGVDARMRTYPGEPHAFGAAWPVSMRRTERFFDRHL